MKKTAFTFALGALAAAIPALLTLRYYRQKDLEELIDQRRRLQKQIDTQHRLLEEAMKVIEAQGAAKK